MRWPEVPYPVLSQRQREYVLGGVLGDDSLVMTPTCANARLRTCQSLAHEEYLVWKYEIMKDHTLRGPRIYATPRYERMHWGVRFHTRATPDLTRLYRLCYPSGKKTVSRAWLDQLTPFSLAVWYMDDGTYAPIRDFAMLHTGAFPYRQQLIIGRYLSDRWNVTDFRIQQNRAQWCFRFTRRGTQQLLNIVEPYIASVPIMNYKLGGPERRWKRPVNDAMNRWLNTWRPDEDRVLRAKYGHMPAERLAKEMRRTLNAVYLRANKLGLSGWQSDRVSDGYCDYIAN